MSFATHRSINLLNFGVSKKISFVHYRSKFDFGSIPINKVTTTYTHKSLLAVPIQFIKILLFFASLALTDGSFIIIFALFRTS